MYVGGPAPSGWVPAAWSPAPPQQQPPQQDSPMKKAPLGHGVKVTTASIPIVKLPRLRLSEAIESTFHTPRPCLSHVLSRHRSSIPPGMGHRG